MSKLSSLLVLAALASSCTTLPANLTRGNEAIHARWGYAITNEAPNSFDLEVAVQEYAGICTTGEGQLERARDVFITCAQNHVRELGREPEAFVLVKLPVTHVRAYWDDTCTMRVSDRIRLKPKR